jgi:hypothetical protein
MVTQTDVLMLPLAGTRRDGRPASSGRAGWTPGAPAGVLDQIQKYSRSARPEERYSASRRVPASGAVILGTLLLMLTTAHQTFATTETRKHTASEALATIGYLAQKEQKKANLNLLKEDLRLFIKKIVLLAREDREACPDLFRLDEQLKTDFANIEMELLLDALSNAAYVIKNRAETDCSAAEVQRLNDELHRWCAWAMALVNGQPG